MTDAAAADLVFQIFKSVTDSAVVFSPGRFYWMTVLLSPLEVVFRIVEQVEVQCLQVKAFQAAIQLIL